MWRVRGQNAWASRYQDLPQRVAKDSAHGGEDGSLKEVLQYCWHLFLIDWDLGDSDCPVVSMFP